MIKQYLYVFNNTSIDSDVYNANAKIIKYKEVNSIAINEITAREKAKLNEEYVLVNIKNLGDDWHD